MRSVVLDDLMLIPERERNAGFITTRVLPRLADRSIGHTSGYWYSSTSARVDDPALWAREVIPVFYGNIPPTNAECKFHISTSKRPPYLTFC